MSNIAPSNSFGTNLGTNQLTLEIVLQQGVHTGIFGKFYANNINPAIYVVCVQQLHKL